MEKHTYKETLDNLAETLMADRRAKLQATFAELAIGGADTVEPRSEVQILPAS